LIIVTLCIYFETLKKFAETVKFYIKDKKFKEYFFGLVVEDNVKFSKQLYITLSAR